MILCQPFFSSSKYRWWWLGIEQVIKYFCLLLCISIRLPWSWYWEMYLSARTPHVTFLLCVVRLSNYDWTGALKRQQRLLSWFSRFLNSSSNSSSYLKLWTDPTTWWYGRCVEWSGRNGQTRETLTGTMMAWFLMDFLSTARLFFLWPSLF